jgi:hypothetical protein
MERCGIRARTDLPLKSVGRADAAITGSGEVLVVFSATYEGGPLAEDGTDVSVVMGRSSTPQATHWEDLLCKREGSSSGRRSCWPATRESRGAGIQPLWCGKARIAGKRSITIPCELVAARLFTIGGAAEPLLYECHRGEAVP